MKLPYKKGVIPTEVHIGFQLQRIAGAGFKTGGWLRDAMQADEEKAKWYDKAHAAEKATLLLQ